MTEQALLFAEPEPKLGDVEAWCRTHGIHPVVGVDEAGRGPLAGPVYAAAVVLDLQAADQAWFELLDDSKKLSASAREEAAEAIRENALAWAVAFRDAAAIDEINILQATLRSMEDAVESVHAQLGETPHRVFIDGNQRIQTDLVQQTLIKGDGRSFHVAAASILAKTDRDRLMLEAHEEWPHYAFDSNKGYGTQAHRRAIAEHGPCPLHRRTFGGVREYLARTTAG